MVNWQADDIEARAARDTLYQRTGLCFAPLLGLGAAIWFVWEGLQPGGSLSRALMFAVAASLLLGCWSLMPGLSSLGQLWVDTAQDYYGAVFAEKQYQRFLNDPVLPERYRRAVDAEIGYGRLLTVLDGDPAGRSTKSIGGNLKMFVDSLPFWLKLDGLSPRPPQLQQLYQGAQLFMMIGILIGVLSPLADRLDSPLTGTLLEISNPYIMFPAFLTFVAAAVGLASVYWACRAGLLLALGQALRQG